MTTTAGCAAVLATSEPIPEEERDSAERELGLCILGPTDLPEFAHLLIERRDLSVMIERQLLDRWAGVPQPRELSASLAHTLIRARHLVVFDLSGDHPDPPMLTLTPSLLAASPPDIRQHLSNAIARSVAETALAATERRGIDHAVTTLRSWVRSLIGEVSPPKSRASGSEGRADDPARFFADFGIAPTDPATADALYSEALREAAAERDRVLAQCAATAEVQELLGGIQRAAVSKRVKQGTLLAVKDKNELRFPRWQFDAATDDRVVAGLAEVLAALPVRPYGKLLWLQQPHRELGERRPIDALRAGDLEEVLAAAQALNA